MEPEVTTKQRHGCVTAWLVMMILTNSAMALVYLFAGNLIAESSPVPISTPMMILMGVVGIANVVCAIALFQWKKWGFWGFIATAIIALGVNLSVGLDPGQSLVGLVGIGILYAILQIKQGDHSAWELLD